MIKLFALLFSVLLAVASVGGYMYLDAKIIAGEGKISGGQMEVDKGQPALDKGKAKLEAGKIELAEGKAKYEKAHDNLFMVFMDKVFNRGKGFEEGRSKIAEGDKQVAQGEAKISAGEKRLAAGELELYRGKEQLNMAKNVRIACALGAIFFGVLSIVLTILWRRSLLKVFK
jgi:hypothetical protein